MGASGTKQSTEAQEAENREVMENPTLLLEYAHSGRSMPYRTECFEANPEELERIRALLEKGTPPSSSPWERVLDLAKGGPRKIIIDTDVGTDADDILTLLAAVHLPAADVEIVGVTTNYYPTALRKEVAQRIVSAAGDAFESVPIVAGPGGVCGTHRPYFLHGNEGEGLGLATEELKELWRMVPIEEGGAAVELIMSSVRAWPQAVTIVSIGIPTNLGLCAREHGEEFARLVGHVVFMGGGSSLTAAAPIVDQDTHPLPLPSDPGEAVTWLRGTARQPVTLFPNHNCSGDTLATKLLFDLPACPISVVPHRITAKFWLKGRSIETLLHHGAPADAEVDADGGCEVARGPERVPGEVVVTGRLLFEWLSRRRGQRGQCPHDPLTLHEAVYVEGCEGRPPALTYARGTFVAHEWASYMTFVRDDNGPHRIAVDVVDNEEFVVWLEATLVHGVPLELQVDKSPVKTTHPALRFE